MPIAGEGRIYWGDTLLFDPGVGGGGGGTLSDHWPSPLASDGVDSATSSRSSVSATASATPHTPGTYVEIDASLSADASGVCVGLTANTNTSGGDSSTLLEIATGAAASETVWATVPVGYITATTLVYVPGHIAAGSRVAVRAQSVTASKVVTAAYSFIPAKTPAPGSPVSMGVNTATSRGTVLTPPGSINTKGAWTEIEDSTPADLGVLGLFVQGAGEGAMQNSGVLIDIGVGASGSETVLVPNVYLGGSSNESYNRPTPMIYGVDVPAGSRLSARYARAGTGNAVDLALVGA